MQISLKIPLAPILKGSKASVSVFAPPAAAEEDVLVTLAEDDVPKVKKEQTVCDWPGEYESRGVMVQILLLGKNEPSRATKIILDDVACVHLGNPAEQLTGAEEEQLGSVDVLFVQLGVAKLSAKDLKSAIESIEPKLLLPLGGTEEEVTALAKSFGLPAPTAESVLKLKRSDLNPEKMELRWLSA